MMCQFAIQAQPWTFLLEPQNMSEKQPFEYGGGHLIQDLVAGKEVELRAEGYGTDCYPRTQIKTNLTKDDFKPVLSHQLP